MGGTFFTSDTHFSHVMVAELRGFGSAAEHDEAVITNWNKMVGPDDTVWHLGDVGMRKPFLPLVARLNGTIHLVAGNHDAVWPGHRDAFRHQREWLEVFASVQAFARRRIAGQQVLLSHFPYEGDHTVRDRYPQYRLPDEGLWLLHGHTHSKERLRAWCPQPAVPGQTGLHWRRKQLQVGLDAWDLAPVPLHVVEQQIRAEEAFHDMVALTADLGLYGVGGQPSGEAHSGT